MSFTLARSEGDRIMVSTFMELGGIRIDRIADGIGSHEQDSRRVLLERPFGPAPLFRCLR